MSDEEYTNVIREIIESDMAFRAIIDLGNAMNERLINLRHNEDITYAEKRTIEKFCNSDMKDRDKVEAIRSVL